MRLVAIGGTGDYTVYVGCSISEAKQRYFKKEVYKPSEDNYKEYFESEGDWLSVETVEVKDNKFHAYSIWEE